MKLQIAASTNDFAKGQAGHFKACRAHGGGGLARFAATAFLVLSAAVSTAHAQSSILQKGDGVITGFSGVSVPDTAFPPGVNPLDKILIDTEGASAQILRLAPQAPLQGQVLTPSVFKVKASDIGQVFGVALDDAPVRNIYLGATSAYGLQIVTPDTDGDGKPERSRLGSPNASWMPGQFGNGGGPGSIYRVDGVTGAVSLFATIPTNSGPGIGQIVFDKTTRQFFASDLDSGLIHRIDMTGALRGSFDHGVTGRTAAGLPPVADDGITMTIKSSTFTSDDPSTWGYAPNARRVWGMAVNGGRLYYAVVEGPQVWSVSIGGDGSFGSDPRLEIDVSSLAPAAISAITFDDNGLIYLAQRGAQYGSYDYSIFAEPNHSVVARYRRDPANGAAWVAAPEVYAIGADPDYRNASGGIDIGQGVGPDGRPSGQCSLLWSTGDALKRLGMGADAGIIHGLQANDIGAVRPADTPPTQTNFVDYDQMFADTTAAGHIGSIVAWRNCEGTPMLTAQAVPFAPSSGGDFAPGGGFFPDGGWPSGGQYPVPPTLFNSHLKVDKTASGECLHAMVGSGYLCTYTVTVTNEGPDPFSGTMVISDQTSGPLDYGSLSPVLANSDPWKCQSNGSNAIQCWMTVAKLSVGDKKTLKVDIRIEDEAKAPCDVQNVASMVSPPGNASSASSKFEGGHCRKVPHLTLTKKADPDNPCTSAGCWFIVTITNTGTAPEPGPIKVRESSASGEITKVTAPWDCPGPAALSRDCTLPGPLAVGASVQMRAFVQSSKCEVFNQAKLMAPPGNSETAIAHSSAQCEGLGITKKFESCRLPAGSGSENDALADIVCTFSVTVSNENLFAVYDKLISFTDIPGELPGTTPVVISRPHPPWNCTDEATSGAGAFRCTTNEVLRPMGKITTEVAIVMPQYLLRDSYLCRLSNTARLDGSQKESTAYAVVTIGICGTLPDAKTDLQLTKVPGRCGASGGGNYGCSFDIYVRNVGAQDVPAGVQIRDTMLNDFPINLGANIYFPWNCNDHGFLLDCTLNEPIKAGKAALLHMDVTVPAEIIKRGICNVFNKAAITFPLPHTEYNATGSNDIDYANLDISDPLPAGCVPLFTVMKGTFPIAPSCSPGFGFSPAIRKCLPNKTSADNTPPPPPAGCPPGFRLDRESRCAPVGVAPPGPTSTPQPCPPGQIGTPPNCALPLPPQPCPAGLLGTPPNCHRPDVQPCPAGTVGTPPDCRSPRGPVAPPPPPPPPVACPPGFTGTPPDCHRLSPPPPPPPSQCPSGTTGTPPNCRPLTCPEGTRGRPPNCEPIPCPEGTRGQQPNCVPIIRPRPEPAPTPEPKRGPRLEEAPKLRNPPRCPPNTGGPNCMPIVR